VIACVPWMTVCYWHETDLPPRVRHIRCQGMNGLILDAAQGLSLTHRGSRTFEVRLAS
jgi:hypothetical protein